MGKFYLKVLKLFGYKVFVPDTPYLRPSVDLSVLDGDYEETPTNS